MTAPEHLTCTVVLVDDRTARVLVSGDLVHGNGDVLRDAISDLLAEHRPAHLHLDFTDLSLCDSTGLSVLLGARRAADAVGAALHLEHRPAWLDRVLRRTGTFHHLVPDQVEDRRTG
ncbi:STAS domain-containing protein [Saccharothrix syringae]|uniref:STAS domain-containing protein n=1 Tax=Saccharothrix syringae TaxID=103733 RepID=UPI00068B9230|nr:STAS domain-containing protein [Saccharothrix syringae]